MFLKILKNKLIEITKINLKNKNVIKLERVSFSRNF